jgi:hypothetical protein
MLDAGMAFLVEALFLGAAFFLETFFLRSVGVLLVVVFFFVGTILPPEYCWQLLLSCIRQPG